MIRGWVRVGKENKQSAEASRGMVKFSEMIFKRIQ
jgi:hypothetical protein